MRWAANVAFVGGDERCIWGFDGEIWRQKTTLKTWAWTGLIWLRAGTGDGLFWTRKDTCVNHRRRALPHLNSWLWSSVVNLCTFGSLYFFSFVWRLRCDYSEFLYCAGILQLNILPCSGIPRNFFSLGGSTNSVKDRGQRKRGSGGDSLLVMGSAQFANKGNTYSY
jgi:hypothetical protein